MNNDGAGGNFNKSGDDFGNSSRNKYFSNSGNRGQTATLE